jgi:DNA-3-methyladenine glycosylase II
MLFYTVAKGYAERRMTNFLRTQDDLEAGLQKLLVADPRLVPAAAKAGSFALRRREAGYPGLCAIVCGQQLSTSAAAAIRDRLFKALDPFHHDAVRLARPDKLKRLGLSNNKIKAIKEIGKAVARGEIDLDAVGNMDADIAHAELVKLHGVGPWTADIYLLFCLAVQEAAKIALGLRKRPSPDRLTKIAEAWRPWRGVAAHLMWAYYHVVKRREGISLETKTKPKATKAKLKAKTKGKTNGRRAKS